ncbi:hypothetical protein N5U05_02790 [Aliarcobacter butzleri]|uniref:hypothetical protein n=1 Tax=Aliarcobacter butzleri TaxID=28197 RepID=UPI0021B3C7B1|nr:hypothetical protein [Aliarcobacter butzleri]MCT7616656.1 hypothetical protein [Aliarcobacter butzleri]
MGLFSSREYAGTLVWEELDNVGDGSPRYVARAKVFGGWLISSIANPSLGGSGITFIPDPNHEWLSTKKTDNEEEKRMKLEEEWNKRHRNS